MALFVHKKFHAVTLIIHFICTISWNLNPSPCSLRSMKKVKSVPWAQKVAEEKLVTTKMSLRNMSSFENIDGNLSANDVFDVAIVGSGPGGSVMATLLAEKHKIRVVLIDPNIDQNWLPNYGVWVEEWDSLDKLLDIGLGSCLSRTWQFTDCFYGGSHNVLNNEKLRIQRAYGRVARDKMRNTLRERMLLAGTVLMKDAVKADTLEHTSSGSTMELNSGKKISARLILDCSGHKSELVQRQGPHDPGFQIAYGIECEIEGALEPYDSEAMLFMDYRTDFARTLEDEIKYINQPTFLYAMPLGSTEGHQRIFFEETSLVARPGLDMTECKERLYKRLKHHNIKVTKVDEEEFCVIPMGGSLPKFDQRVVAFAGAGGLVHASTGYMQVRMLAAAKPASDAIGNAFANSGSDRSKFDADTVARQIYAAIWPADVRLQRDFHMFGGEFLMKQDVTYLRGFFNAFFKVPLPYWAGFLSGYPNLPHNEKHQTWEQRFLFGVLLWLYAPLPVKIALATSAVFSGVELGLIRSVTPLSKLEYDTDLELSNQVDLNYIPQENQLQSKVLQSVSVK